MAGMQTRVSTSSYAHEEQRGLGVRCWLPGCWLAGWLANSSGFIDTYESTYTSTYASHDNYDAEVVAI